MRKAITLVEIIVTLAVASILSVGMFQALKAVATLAQKAKMRTHLSLDTQSALDQTSSLLYDRVPNSVIGYNPNSDNFESFDNITDTNVSIFEWLGTFSEASKEVFYSGFVDMNASDKNTRTLSTPDTNSTELKDLLNDKWDNDVAWQDLALVFAGSFDTGTSEDRYGFNGSGKEDVFRITALNDNDIELSNANIPTYIYEKYYFVDSAYAIARSEDVDKNSTCIRNLNLRDINNTLLLFYNFQPWQDERFCADPNGNGQSGGVSILAENITNLRVEIINGVFRLSIEANADIRGSNSPVRVSKQKVVF